MTGRILRADQLAETTGQRFQAASLPQYFTGKLTAPLVLVQLNPKQDRGLQISDAYPGPVPTYAEYVDTFAHFGRDNYGPGSPRTHRSRFDHQQIRFLRAFGTIDFATDDEPDSRWINLQRSIDDKLQLEVIPYASHTLSTQGMTPAVLDVHYRRVLDTISAVERSYVIFCGRLLAKLLRPWVTRKHRFPLRKKDGTATASAYRYANLAITHDGHTIKAGLAPSYPRQGIPMDAYARECAARYHA